MFKASSVKIAKLNPQAVKADVVVHAVRNTKQLRPPWRRQARRKQRRGCHRRHSGRFEVDEAGKELLARGRPLCFVAEADLNLGLSRPRTTPNPLQAPEPLQAEVAQRQPFVPFLTCTSSLFHSACWPVYSHLHAAIFHFSKRRSFPESKEQKVLGAAILQLSRSIKDLQEENQSLKADLDRALASSPTSTKANCKFRGRSEVPV